MAVDPRQLAIVHYPADVLRQSTRDVESVDQEVIDVANRMLELMRQAPGVGLAAPQVGLNWRMFVANATQDAGDDGVYINPRIVEPSRETESREEGCLSLPQVYADITRPVEVTIEYVDLNGETTRQRSGDLLARIWQHETDHLDGVLILDRMTRIDKLANRRAIKDLEGRGR